MSSAEVGPEQAGADGKDAAAELWAFMRSQSHLVPVSLEQVKGAKRREELGLTSLAVIMLVAAYMEARGVPQVGFKPEWVPRLDTIEGLMHVFSDIRRAVSTPTS